MARKQQSPKAIAAVPRRVESGVHVTRLAGHTGFTKNAIHLWKKKYG